HSARPAAPAGGDPCVPGVEVMEQLYNLTRPEVVRQQRPTKTRYAQSALRARAIASRATIRRARRAAIRVLWRGHHGGGRYAEAPLPPAPVLPRGRGALAYCFSPSRSPSTRWDRPQKLGTDQDDHARSVARDKASWDGEGERGTPRPAFQDRCLQPGSATPPDGASPLPRDGARAKGRMRGRTAPAAAGAGLSEARSLPTMRRCAR